MSDQQYYANSMMQHSFEDNTGICQLTEVLKICLHMHWFHSDRIWSF